MVEKEHTWFVSYYYENKYGSFLESVSWTTELKGKDLLKEITEKISTKYKKFVILSISKID